MSAERVRVDLESASFSFIRAFSIVKYATPRPHTFFHILIFTEACGQDIAAMEVPQQSTIAETPPALRSMHTNTRRLQAALEAERFDRNYLQEELSRVNIKMEHLCKYKYR